MKNLYKIENELYIISNNENVDENCWIITDGKLVQVSYLLSDEVAKGNKIILTTNKLLIKDGVQAIDDEFLQWYVKNPSCEFVEVSEDYFKPSNMVYGHNTEHYKIIIPKEEPKPIHQQIIDIVGGEDRFKEIAGIKPKQETFTYIEAAKKEERIFNSTKWQQERMYSEEEVLDLLNHRSFDLKFKKDVKTSSEWFEKFKKK
jgi:hypothetical protein